MTVPFFPSLCYTEVVGEVTGKMKSFFKNKRAMRVMMIICLVLAAGSLTYIGIQLVPYFQAMSENGKVGDIYDPSYTQPIVAVSPTPWPGGTPTIPPALASEEVPTQPPQDERDLLLQAEEQNRLRPDFAKLLEMNPDFRGMLLIEGLKMQLPYVQGMDNEKYLVTNFEGKKSAYGAVFLSAWNDRLLTDHNNVLFGHYVDTGIMFTPLHKYKNIQNAKNATTIVLDGLTGKTTWLVFAAYVCEPDWGYIDPVDGEEFAALLEEAQQRSFFVSSVDVNENDRILTLSTCAYEFNDARMVVQARQLRPGEEIPEITVEKNPHQQPYNVPKLLKFADLPANRTTTALQPATKKTYYFQAALGQIEYYIGNTSSIQGPYTCYTGAITPESTLSAVYYRTDKIRRAWIAADKAGSKPGIYLLKSGVLAGPYSLVSKDPVTPSGVDARNPLLAVDDSGVLWLSYTVAEQDGWERLYRLPIRDGVPGIPELILARVTGTGVKPMGMFWVDQNPLLLWQETKTKQLFYLWIGETKGDALNTSGDFDRISFYGPVTNGQVKMTTEKNGKLTAGSFSVSAVPKPAAQVVLPVDPTPDPADVPVIGPDTTPPDEELLPTLIPTPAALPPDEAGAG